MQYASIYANFLNGSMLSRLFKLPILEDLDLSSNQLGGEIPNTICDNDSKLCNLDLGNNIIFGPIPREIGECKRMDYLNIHANFLNGSMPSTLFEPPSMNIWIFLTINLKKKFHRL